MGFLAEKLEKYTAEISKFETSRNYISLSNAALPAEELLNQYYQGFEDSLAIRLRCYKGYQMERDLKDRLFKLPGIIIVDHFEISTFEGLVKGHPDFLYQEAIEYYPGDCKSVPLDEHLPELKLPRKVFMQMQAYMLYSEARKSIVIYESRETGKLRDYIVSSVYSVQRDIHLKYESVINQIKKAA